jgi:hypothetical protein
MDLSLRVSGATIGADSSRKIYVDLEGVDISELVHEAGIGNLLAEIGKEEAIDFFEIKVAEP